MALRSVLDNLTYTNSLRLVKSPGIVVDEDFPDPEGFYDTASATWYILHTNGTRGNVPMWSTPTPQVPGTYTFVGDMMPNASAPSTITLGQNWAPAMAKLVTGQYIIYSTAAQASNGKHAIWYGTANAVTGPYTWPTAPLLVRDSLGGCIDPKFFPDPATGINYLLWKGDSPGGNGVTNTTPLVKTPLDRTGTIVVGYDTTILTNDRNWETKNFSNIEAACVRLRGSKYYLFYSSRYYGDNSYNSSYAVANSVLGPYMKPNGPHITSDDSRGVWGPGGATVMTMPDGTDYILFHSWQRSIPEGQQPVGGDYRRLFCWRIVFRQPVPTNIGG